MDTCAIVVATNWHVRAVSGWDDDLSTCLLCAPYQPLARCDIDPCVLSHDELSYLP